MIQNAMDAVDLRKMNENSKTNKQSNYRKQIKIVIDIRENSIYVADNGVGFGEAQFKAFLSPNVTYKSGKRTRGNKGVGATYLGYGFNRLEMYTKTEEFNCYAIFENARRWVEGEEVIGGECSAPPEVEIREYLGNFEFDKGSFFKIFLDEQSHPSDLGWVKSNTAEQWKYILSIKTPLGYIADMRDNNDSAAQIYFKLSVIDKEGNETHQPQENTWESDLGLVASHCYPHTFFKDERVKRLSELDKLGPKDKENLCGICGIYEFYDTPILVNLVRTAIANAHEPKDAERAHVLKESDIEDIEYFGITAYGFQGYSSKVFSEIINESKIKTRKGFAISSSGLLIATNNMPQGDSATEIPLKSNVMYKHKIQAIVHFAENAEPDLGRKGFDARIRLIAEKLSIVIANNLLCNVKYKFFQAESFYSNYDIEADVNAWRDDYKEHEKNNPINISSSTFCLPQSLPLTSNPKSEQDVIMLFGQMLGCGIIRSIKIMATNQHSTYDGLFKYNIDNAEACTYDEKLNPLGVFPSLQRYKDNVGKVAQVVEYKFSADSLLADIANSAKFFKDLNLVVAWKMGSGWKKEFSYSVGSYLLSDNPSRSFHGLTHKICNNNGDYIDCIILEELIQYLNNREEYERKYRDTYEVLGRY